MGFEGKTVVVTGGAGFIGSAVSRAMLERGANVHVIDDLFAGRVDLVPDGATFHEIDIRTEDLRALFVDIEPDAIVHLAAIHYIPYCNDHPEEAYAVNVLGTRRLLDAARRVRSLRKVVFASSAAVYPALDGPLSETVEPGPLDVYGETKLLGEDLMRLFNLDTGVPTAAARLFNVYGPNETNPHLIPAIIDQLAGGEREVELGNLSPKRDFVHVSDVARALVTMTSDFEGEFQAFNVGTGRSISVGEVVETAGRALGETITIRQDDSRMRPSDRPDLQADPTRIETELGWEPTVGLADGLGELVG